MSKKEGGGLTTFYGLYPVVYGGLSGCGVRVWVDYHFYYPLLCGTDSVLHTHEGVMMPSPSRWIACGMDVGGSPLHPYKKLKFCPLISLRGNNKHLFPLCQVSHPGMGGSQDFV